MSTPISSSKFALIRQIYLYLVCLISIVIMTVASIDLVNLGLRNWVFPKADQNEYTEPPCPIMIAPESNNQETETVYQKRLKSCEESRISKEEMRTIRNQRDAVRDLSMLAVSIPLFLSHWFLIRRERRLRIEN